MTLACKTADILALATHALTQLMSNQHDLRSADERKAALTQLATTVQTAAKLADVVHMEALAGSATRRCDDTGGTMMEEIMRKETERAVVETQRLEAETDRVKAEANRVGKETERAVAETERLNAEAVMMESEKMKIDAETERIKVEKGTGNEPERALIETERAKAEAMMVMSEKTKIDTRTEKVKTETERTSVEEETVGEEVESSGHVQDGYGPKPFDYLHVIETKIEGKEREMTNERSYVRWAKLRVELAGLGLERDRVVAWLMRMQQPEQ